MLPNPLTSTRHRPFFLAEASVAATKQGPPAAEVLLRQLLDATISLC